MNKNKIWLSVFFLLSASVVQAQGLTPEEACMANLQAEMKDDSIFANVDITKVKKINGPEEDQVESGEFSLATYDDFLAAFDVPVPTLKEDIQYYPSQLFNVSPVYATKLEVAKSNRNLSGILTYNDDIETGLGDLDGDGEEEVINGYYTDTKYVTFGRENAFVYPPVSRDPNPDSRRDFPGGHPYQDMREFIVFFQHLAEPFGGDLLSCGVFTFDPGDQYVLKAHNEGETEVSADLFWRTDVQASDAKYATVENDGHRFLKSVLRDTFLSRQRDEEGNNPVLMVYNQVLLSYDSGNSFLNDFEVARYTRNFMTDPANLNRSFTQMRQRLYQELVDNTEFGVVGGDGTGGLAIYEGVPLELVQKVESIEDQGARDMIRAALVPNYGRYFGGFEELDLSDEANQFYATYMQYPLDYQKRLENVEFIVDQAEDIAKLDVDTLEYKDMEFGGAVIPVMDSRLRKIAEQDYIDEDFEALLAERDRKIAEIKARISAEPDALKQQELRAELYAIEEEYAQKLSLIQAFESKFKTFKMEFADVENKKTHGRITEEEYDSARRLLFDEFQDYVSEKGVVAVIGDSKYESLSDNLVNTLKPEAAEPEVVTQNDPVVEVEVAPAEPWYYKFFGFGFLVGGLLLGWGAYKIYKKNN